jgi:DNA-directed RNA polymerase specialized sigma24 family protein
MADDALVRSIDAKLGAVLALMLDAHLRQTEIARPKERTIDELLAAAGVPTQEIARLLGKTDRAVRKQLAGGKKKPRKATPKKVVRGG